MRKQNYIIIFNSLDDMLFKNRAAKKKRIRLSWNNFDQVSNMFLRSKENFFPSSFFVVLLKYSKLEPTSFGLILNRCKSKRKYLESKN